MAVAPLSTSQAPWSQVALAQVASAQAAPAQAASPARPETWRLGAPQGESAPLHPHAADAVASYEEGLTFWDFLDLVNPLQHIPGVAQVYRAVTGDEIKAPVKIAGGALLGGPVGLVAAVAGAAVEESSGKDIGGHVLAWFGGQGEAPPETGATGTMVAEAAPAPGPSAGPSAAAAPRDAASRAAEAAAVAGSPAPAASVAPAPVPAAVELASAAPAPAPAAGAARAFAVPPRPGDAQPRAFPAPARLSGTAAAHPMRHPAPAPRDTAQQVAEAAAADARGGAPSSASPSPAAPAPAAPTPAAQAAGWPPGGPAALPRELIADAMMGALDKYQRSARLGTRQAPSAGLPPT